MTKRIIDNLTYTSYSDSWIHDDKIHTENKGQDNERKVIYRPKQMVVVYNNKHMGICTDIKNIPADWNSKRIMQEAIYYAGKNTLNISFIWGTYHAFELNISKRKEGINRGEEIDKDYVSSFPVFSKKGGKLVQIDVNLAALLTVSDLYQLNDKLMHEFLKYKMNPNAKTHDCKIFTDEQCTTKVWADNDTGYEPYRSVFRPQLELALDC